MKITFGMNMDGSLWNTGSASMGEVKIGPGGMVGLLETRLGMTMPTVHPVRRINETMGRLDEVAAGRARDWFGKSYEVDAWSTARQLLAWRDQLVEAGWDGKTTLLGSPRLEAIACLEQSQLPLFPGTGDRINRVLAALGECREGDALGLESICLVEPREFFPPVWGWILDRLEDLGVRITQLSFPDHSGVISSNGDDSLILLKADNEWEGAAHLALWLAAARDENKSVAIICGMDTGILDQALAAHNLPRLGRSAPSKWREAQQILPLILSNAWKPLDIQRLVELLSLSIPPFPGWACRLLLSAIAREPGVDGKEWNQALAKIQEQRLLELTQKGETDGEAKAWALVSEIQSLLVDLRFDPEEGIPEEELRRRCQKVIDLLGWKVGMDSRLASVIGQARELQQLSMGKGKLARTALERMLDTVIGVGTTSEDSLQEAAHWHVVDHPGQLTESWDTVVWWGFQDNENEETTYWSREERAALEQAGVLLEATSSIRRRQAFAWQQGLLCAKNRFIAGTLSQIDGEEAYHHPFWDFIRCDEAKVRECKDLDGHENWTFGGRAFKLRPVPPTPQPTTQKECRVRPDAIKPPKRLSYSQMSTLIGCPMKWALEYHAGLRLPESQTVPSGNQMIGTLCHRIVEELYAQGNGQNPIVQGALGYGAGQPIPEADAVKQAEILYDKLLLSMAAELLLDGSAVERRRYKAAVAKAVGGLVSAINKRNLRVEQTEAQLESTLDQIPFIGYADLLLRDPDGKPFVLDLKWSYTDKHHRQAVEQGTALQLATYAWMLRSADDARGIDDGEAATGYFMLAQGKLLSDSPDLTEDVIPVPYSLEQTWALGAAAFRDSMHRMEQGQIQIRGVAEMLDVAASGTTEDKLREDLIAQGQSKGMLYQEPPCRFCDFGGICGKIDGAAETQPETGGGQ